jgi:hypothetical protein
MGKKLATNVILFTANVLQAVALLAIVLLVSRRLYKFDYNTETNSPETVSCALDKDEGEESLCTLAFTGAGITFGILLATSLLLVRPLLYVSGVAAEIKLPRSREESTSSSRSQRHIALSAASVANATSNKHP